jgi:hypothetical protein
VAPLSAKPVASDGYGAGENGKDIQDIQDIHICERIMVHEHCKAIERSVLYNMSHGSEVWCVVDLYAYSLVDSQHQRSQRLTPTARLACH